MGQPAQGASEVLASHPFRNSRAWRAYMQRLKRRAQDHVAPLSTQAALAELDAIREWVVITETGRFGMLGRIRHPTLIVHGVRTLMSINGFLLASHLHNAHLIMYPGASHGAQSQQAEVFRKHPPPSSPRFA